MPDQQPLPHHRNLLMPPDECPNDGLCISIQPDIDRLKLDMARVERNAGTALNVANTLQVRLEEREKVNNRIFAMTVGIAGLVVVHFCMFLVWMGGTNERLSSFKESDTKQNIILERITERLNSAHLTTP